MNKAKRLNIIAMRNKKVRMDRTDRIVEKMEATI